MVCDHIAQDQIYLLSIKTLSFTLDDVSWFFHQNMDKKAGYTLLSKVNCNKLQATFELPASNCHSKFYNIPFLNEKLPFSDPPSLPPPTRIYVIYWWSIQKNKGDWVIVRDAWAFQWREVTEVHTVLGQKNPPNYQSKFLGETCLNQRGTDQLWLATTPQYFQCHKKVYAL